MKSWCGDVRRTSETEMQSYTVYGILVIVPNVRQHSDAGSNIKVVVVVVVVGSGFRIPLPGSWFLMGKETTHLGCLRTSGGW